ncbi:cytochrome c biogenesis protein DipZ [Herbaspirillum sp. LeCh32-8]|uniref:cytochrome c biogenesis protein DipZ n=1 Tax=Herbaspirillum sp. LeCh32-8 TaxID=2821356 RepID=UPI001AEB5E4F|nr:cytochrome c biogenesis protein DipZ [Herbaspirillum sp. LeCh32-8]MBP0598034.1 cytochrome c biogenesis protein DipZ [Herbaspirillum sp. LeCh32-8]
MILYLAAFLGGALTLLSPCILPVLPFLFARADQPFLTARLPMLAGMALVFAAVATLAAVGANWAVHVNEIGRIAAMLVLALFGLALVWPALALLLARPGVMLGNVLAEHSRRRPATVSGSVLLGAATGLLWTPCAGPILGLVLSGAAWQGPSVQTAGLLLAYAAGATSALGLCMAAGARLLAAARRRLHVGEWVRRALGVAVLAGVASVAVGADFTPPGSSRATDKLENVLLEWLTPERSLTAGAGAMAGALPQSSQTPRPYRSLLPVEGQLPALDGAVEWLNSAPLTVEQLRGKVVLVDFWTYSCINCIRTLPYVRAWAEKYKDQGLVVIGVHTPEFAFEKKVDNVKKALGEFKLGFPVAVDSNFRIWRAFNNSYWPAIYLADAQGKLRYHHFGEGRYEASEKAIQELLKEVGSRAGGQAAAGSVAPDAPGIQAAPDLAQLGSDETYLGYRQATGFNSNERVLPDVARDYSAAPLGVNQWSLDGNWRVGAEAIIAMRAGAGIAYRFSARDLHLVLGPDQDGRPVRFQVTVDGKAPGELHGADIDAAGRGTVERTRLFQLVRQRGEVKPRTFEVRFLDPGATAYAFTFG